MLAATKTIILPGTSHNSAKAFAISSLPSLRGYKTRVVDANAAADEAKKVISSYKPADPKSLDWSKLPFDVTDVNCTMMTKYKNGSWDKEFTAQPPFVTLHSMSNALHYGQACFEGLKAVATKQGKVVVINPEQNGLRMNSTATRLAMQNVPMDAFLYGIDEAVKRNVEYVPPYGSGGALYIRPFLFGHGKQVRVIPAQEFIYGVNVMPVGPYYPTGVKAMEAAVVENYDRAAPRGVGGVKVAGNYAADLMPSKQYALAGKIALYLDAKTNNKIEEFSTSNFIAITKDGKKYVTPSSDSILPSITNKMLRQLAEKLGLKVEMRDISLDEVRNGDFAEVAACGTAVILTPIKAIHYGNEKIVIGETFPKFLELYKEFNAVLKGESPDTFGWLREAFEVRRK